MEIVSDNNIDVCDPHGYCKIKIIDDLKRFYIPWKRRNLGDHIRELHIMNDARVIPPSTTGYLNKQLLCKLIDDILDVQKPKIEHIDYVKRQLFRSSRKTKRKPNITRKNKHKQSTCFKFRCIRKKIGVRKFKKSFLDEARVNVTNDMESKENNKRRLSTSSTDSCDSSIGPKLFKKENSPKSILQVKTDDGVFPISTSKLAEVCKFHEKMVRYHPAKIRTEREQFKRNLNTEACRLSRRVSKLAGIILDEQYRERKKINEKIVEESVRSIHYLKSLLDILLNHDDKKCLLA